MRHPRTGLGVLQAAALLAAVAVTACRGTVKAGDTTPAAACPQDETSCAGGGGAPYCANLASDDANCGSCGAACPGGTACANGWCSTSCGRNLTRCSVSGDTYCADTRYDPTNCGRCGLACDPGDACRQGHCCAPGTTYCGGACVDLMTDKANCGACGTACAGTSCAGGVCRTVTTVASNASSPGCDQVAIALDANNVYWASNGVCSEGAVFKCPKIGCGGSPEVLAKGTFRPYAIAVDDHDVYWTGSSVSFCAKDGCNNQPTTFASLHWSAGPIATDPSRAYWDDGGTIWACDTGGPCASPTQLTSVGVSSSLQIALDASNVYFTNVLKGQILGCAKTGCLGGPTVIASAQRYPVGLGIDSGHVYWTEGVQGGAARSCPLGGCLGGPTTLADNQPMPWVVAADGTNVVWGTWGGASLYECPASGCKGAPFEIATQQGGQVAIAVDGASVYYYDSSVDEIRKVNAR